MDLDSLSDAELIVEVRTWAARVARGDAKLAELIGELDVREAWFVDGSITSCAGWLSWQLGWSASTARERVRVARALRGLPLIRAAFLDGQLSYSQVRGITRIATAEGESDWLALARVSTAEQLDKIARGAARVKALNRPEHEQAPKQMARVEWDDDGDLLLTVRVPAHQAPAVLAVLESHQQLAQTERDAAVQQLLADTLTDPSAVSASAEALSGDGAQLSLLTADSSGDPVPVAAASAEASEGVVPLPRQPEPATTTPEPTAELSPELARALAEQDAKGHDPLACYPYEEPPLPFPAERLCPLREADRPAYEQWQARRDWQRAIRDAWDARRSRLLAEAAARRVPTGKATLADGLVRALTRPADGPKTTVRLLVDPLSGWARTQHDELLPPATLEALTQLLPTRWARGQALPGLTGCDQGRSSRTVSPKLRRLLGQVDGERCRFPGCTHTRFLHAHHVRFWRDGGRTDLDNVLLVCTRHHVLIHQLGYILTLDAQRRLTVTSPDGQVLEHHPKLPDASAEALPAAPTPLPTSGYQGDRLDLDYAVHAMLAHAA